VGVLKHHYEGGVALANKIARIAWALMARGGIYRASAAAA
jgi:hypothetical protein